MSIPYNLEELKPLKQWVNYIRIWNATQHGGAGGYDKPPIDPHTLRDGKTTDGATWATYKRAAANIGKTARHRDTKHKDAQGRAQLVSAAVEGAGLVLARGYCGIDLDGVIDEQGNLAPFAARIVDALDTYTELSPSGRGLHCLLYCADLLEAGRNFGKQFLLDGAGRITNEAGKVYEVEIYFYTNGGRYFTVTGKPYHDRPIARDKSKKLLRIYDYYSEKAKQYRAAQAPARPVGTLHKAGSPADDDANKTMIESALQAIDPEALDFGEWAAVMTALKVLGYGLDLAEKWSAGDLCGKPNGKNDPGNNSRRWEKFHFDNGDHSAAGIIINSAKVCGWNPADAFTQEQRTEYGRSLYTQEQRTEYGRSLYTEEQRREYGRKINGLTLDGERRFEEFRTRKTQTPKEKGWS